MQTASPCTIGSSRRLSLELLQEHRHLLFGLFVTMGAGRFEALFPGLTRSGVIT